KLGLERLPRFCNAAISDLLSAVRIVHIEERRLGSDIGRTATARVIGISLDLNRTALVRLCKQAHRDTTDRITGRKKQRHTGQHTFGLRNIRDDLLGRLDNASAQSGESKRSSHHLDELASAKGIVPSFGVVGIFALYEFFKFRGVDKFFNA